MSTTFDESEAEKMVVAACEANGWKYRTQDQYVRPPNSVLVEGVLREALKRLNPCLAEHPENVDSVIYRLRALMLLDEYGSVQQHLQPRHIQEMIIPVPDNWKSAQGMINAGRKFIASMEKMSEADKALRCEGFDALMRSTILDCGGELASGHRKNIALGEAPEESDWEDRMAAFEETEK